MTATLCLHALHHSRFRMILLLVLLGSFSSLSSARTITFAGREWNIRSGTGGPGPNNWSDSTASVWVDSAGLHLKIRRVGDTWYSAEVTSREPTRYGMHRFYISGRVDRLDRNVVASPFLYANDSLEVDVEFSSWQNANPRALNAQFVLQPYNIKGNQERFRMDLTGNESTHYYDWESASIHCKSFLGHSAEPKDSSLVLHDWTYTGKNNPPESANLRIHFNLWLINGRPPTDGQEAEFVIKAVDLPPLKVK
jgi:hypothetical protein